MKERKKSADWYVATTHYLTAGFAIPLIVALIGGFIFVLLFGSVTENDTFNGLFGLFITAIGSYLGVMYSAKYLDRTYIIEHKEKIIKISTIIKFVVPGVFILGKIALTNMSVTIEIFSVISVVLGGILFYLFSNKFIKNNVNNS